MAMTEAEAHAIALVTESLHRAKLNRDRPIFGDPTEDAEAAIVWMVRSGTLIELIESAFDDDDYRLAVVESLSVLTASIVELWANETGREPFEVMRSVAGIWAMNQSPSAGDA